MSKPSKHVVPSPSGGWAVKNSGSVRASKTFDTQQQAVGYGQEAAKKSGTELYIHGRDGGADYFNILWLRPIEIVDPVGMEAELNQITGVVCVGLFAKRAADVVIVDGKQRH